MIWEILNICEASNLPIPIKYVVAKVAHGIKFTELRMQEKNTTNQ